MRLLTILAVILFSLVFGIAVSEAGPRDRRQSIFASSSCAGGQCAVASVSVAAPAAPHTPTAPVTATAYASGSCASASVSTGHATRREIRQARRAARHCH